MPGPGSGLASGLGVAEFLDQVSDGFAVLDHDWRIVYLNAAGAALLAPLFGSRDDLIGRDHWEMFPDLVGTELERIYRKVAEERVFASLETYYEPLKAWFEVRVYPNAQGISIYYVDVTARRLAEAKLEAEKNLLGLVAAGTPLAQTLEAICRETESRSVAGMICSVLLLGEDGRHLHRGAGPSLSEAYNDAIDGLEIGPAVGSCGTAAYLAQPVLAEDIDGDPRWVPFRDLARAEGLRACASRPMLSSKGDVLGTIAMYYRVPTVPDANDEGLIELASQVAAIAVERARVEGALQKAAERLRATFSQAAIGIAIGNLDGHFEEANHKFLDLLGYPIEELRELTFEQLTHPDDRAETRERVRSLLAGEVPSYAVEKRYLRRDGREFWSRTTVTLLRDSRGKPLQFIGAVEDITVRKQAEAALREREESLRALADTMPQLVWMAEGDGRIFWYNRGWYDYTGSSEEEMLRPDGWHRFHDPSVLPIVVERWREAVANGAPFEMEFPLRGVDGRYRTFLTRANPVRDDSGRVVRWLGTNTDLESVDRARRAQLDEARMLELINRAGKALMSQLDLESLLQHVTDAATELSGAKFGAFFYNAVREDGEVYQLYTLSGAPRSAFADFGHPRATPLFGPTFHGAPTIRIDDVTQDPRYGQWGPHHGMPPGHLPVRSYLAVPVTGRSGEVIGGLFFGHPEPGVFTARTERLVAGITAHAAIAIENARLYEALKRGAQEREGLLAAERAARLEAEQASTMKDEFLSTLSHELRTPLSAILGWAHLLQSGPCDAEETASGLDTIARNARAQSKLIDDLLDMSRIVSGKVRLDVQPTDLNTILEATIDATRPSADAKQITLRKVIDPQAGAVIGDPNRLQQVVWNLLSNAVKFTPKGGSVDVALSRVDSQVQISVSDTGVGIDPEFLPHVFDRFRQADASMSRAHGGLGLGLAIVRHLVELHGGSVHAASPGPAQGSTFLVRLPVAATVEALDGGDAPAVTPEQLDRSWVDLAGVRVLVVDDDADTRRIIRQLLERHDAEVRTAANADEALQALAEQPPDALVSDIGMPGADGYQLIARVRELPADAGGQVPALALTAFARSQDRTRALMAGYQAHVAKPFEAQEFLANVGSLVRRV
jgi:PAS domain S-box-containing protein